VTLAVALAGWLCAVAPAQTQLQEFDYDGGTFFQIPSPLPEWQQIGSTFTWVQVEDATGACHVMHNEWATDPENTGKRLYDPKRDLHFFLGLDGTYESMKSGDETWTPGGNGTAVAKIEWTRHSGDAVSYLVWLGKTHDFAHDPRGTGSKGSAGTDLWFQVGPGAICHSFTAAERKAGPYGLQTVLLDSGIAGVPSWRLETGRAVLGTITETGDWLH
jgi:hypothetical protein